MKNTMRLAGIIALVVVIGFGMAACDNGSTSNEVYGCAYSESAKAEVTWDTGEHFTGTHYLLSISFDEAKVNITNTLGQPGGEARWMLYSNLVELNTYVIIEEHDEGGSVRLIEWNGTSVRGFEFHR